VLRGAKGAVRKTYSAGSDEERPLSQIEEQVPARHPPRGPRIGRPKGGCDDELAKSAHVPGRITGHGRLQPSRTMNGGDRPLTEQPRKRSGPQRGYGRGLRLHNPAHGPIRGSRLEIRPEGRPLNG
jgi:hypothetical protein